MATTSAERQAAYRTRHLKSIEGKGERLNTVIDMHTKKSLERLASCYGVTQKAILEKLIGEAEKQVLCKAVGRENEYYDGKLKL